MKYTLAQIQSMKKIERNFALQNAARTGALDDVTLIIQYEKSQQQGSITWLKNVIIRCNHSNYLDALCNAAQKGHIDVVNYLLEIPSVSENAHQNGNEALHSAALCGHVDIVDRLLQIPAISENTDANYDALRWATHYKHWGVVERLMKIDSVHAAALSSEKHLELGSVFEKRYLHNSNESVGSQSDRQRPSP